MGGKGSGEYRKHQPPTPMQRKFVEGLAKNMRQGDAARAAGYKFPDEEAKRLKKSPKLREHIRRALDRAGATDAKTFKTLADALDATKVISAVVIQGKGSNAVEPTDADGKSTDFIDVPDWTNRLRASHDIHELKGYLTPDADAAGPRIVQLIYGHVQQAVVTPEPHGG